MKKEVVILGMVLLGVLLWFFFPRGQSSLLDETVTEIDERVAQELRGGTIEDAEDGKKKYVHETREFSFLFGGELSVTTLPDLDGEILLLRDQEGGHEFQIYATYFDEGGPITASRIQEDLPDLTIENPQTVVLGANKNISALIFNGESEEFGRTREVWFVGGGQLFQVITPEGNDDFIGPILETWEFTQL